MSSHLLIIHIAQVRQLEPVLCRAGQTSQLIWTSSNNAHRSAFSLEDLQHQKGTQPYSSSKYASDLLSLALNIHHNNQVCTTLQKVIFQSYAVSMKAVLLCFLAGFVLVCHLSWFCDDKPDLQHSAHLASVPLDPALAHLLARKSNFMLYMRTIEEQQFLHTNSRLFYADR